MEDYVSLRQKMVPKIYKFIYAIVLFFISAHFLIGISMIYNKATKLWIYEMLSTFFYFSLFLAINKNKEKYTLTSLVIFMNLTIIEVSVQMFIAVICLGNEFEFQHYIYGIMVFIMLESYIEGDIRRTIELLLFSFICYIASKFLLISGISIYKSTPGLIAFYNWANPVATIIFIVICILLLVSIVTEYEGDILYKATHDNLTGLANRNYLQTIPYKHQMTYVAMLDIDDFKKINDTYGHDTGDDVLKSLSKILKDVKREHDDLYSIRWGGEEFILIYNGVEDFLSLVEHVIHEIRDDKVESDNVTLNYHVTIGISDYYDGETIETMIKIADDRLYNGKNSGKDKIVFK